MTPAQFNEYQRQAEVIEQHKKNLEEQKLMTSIEWLIKKIGIIDIKDPYYAEIFEQAKEMHKQEIIDAYNTSFRLRDKPYQTSKKYYNETFKKD